MLEARALNPELPVMDLTAYGSIADAVADRPGRFEAAHGRSIFLDEIGDVSVGVQAKLLRVLQEREFERVGSSRTLKVDVRIIAATNQDLEAAVREKRFREDLYFRLNVVPLLIPPPGTARGHPPAA